MVDDVCVLEKSTMKRVPRRMLHKKLMFVLVDKLGCGCRYSTDGIGDYSAEIGGTFFGLGGVA